MALGERATIVSPVPVLTRSKSQYLHIHDEADGWGARLADEVDQAIHRLGADREVLSVAVTPLATSYNNGGSPTVGVVVTVVWRVSESPED